jgi:host factor-I protein
LILESNSQEQLIFKHAISTVVVSKTGHGFAAAQTSGSAGVVTPQPGAAATAVESEG